MPRRRKQTVATLLYGDHPDLEAVYHHAEIWSDIVCPGGPRGKSGRVAHLLPSSRVIDHHMPKIVYVEPPYYGHMQKPKSFLWNGVSQHFEKIGLEAREDGVLFRTIVGLEPNWVISDPHIVRDAIELNHDKTLMAKRYFMWNDTHYRNDSIWTPLALPIAYPFQRAAVFTSPVDVAPAYAWHSGFHTDAPFAILDYTYLGSSTAGATLREFEGMIPV